MDRLDAKMKKGTLLVIETGEYTDRSWSGPVRLLKTASRRDLAEAYKAQWTKKDDDWEDCPDPSGFLAWLTSAGWVEDVENVESWHVGSYGSFDPY